MSRCFLGEAVKFSFSSNDEATVRGHGNRESTVAISSAIGPGPERIRTCQGELRYRDHRKQKSREYVTTT